MQFYVALRLLTAPLLATERLGPKRGEILDLGCGFGLFAVLMHIRSSARSVHGIDLVPRRVDVARQIEPNGSGLDFFAADARSFPERRFRRIVLIDLLHHVPFDAQDELLEGVGESLTSGGILAVKDLETGPFWKYAFHYVQDSAMTGWSRLTFRSRENMVARLEKFGLSVEVFHVERFRPHPHIV